MAEQGEPMYHGELRAIIERLDERISSLDRNMTEMRADIRHLSGRLFTLHLAMWGAVGVGFTLYKLFPNP
jgi:hypothetical protein